MSIWAIVPVKPFSQAKSRLQGVLGPEQRAALGREFFIHTLDVLAQVEAVGQTLVISRDAAALTLARARRARTVAEAGAPDLNAALWHATAAARWLGAQGVVILPTDLPCLSAECVQALVAEPGTDPVVVVAPDRHAAGTNALFVRPPGLIRYAFGPDSFSAHQARARQAGARLRLFHAFGTELDVDVPEDWKLYQARQMEAPPVSYP